MAANQAAMTKFGGRRMSKIKVLIAFLACFANLALAQDSSSAPKEQAAQSQTVQVSATDLAGMVEHKALPQYPKEAMLKGIQGDVVFKVVVDESGKIVRSELVKGDPLLVAASKDVLKDYRFRPHLVDGAPVGFKSELGYHFALSQKGDETGGTVECMESIP
jgi:TonB family protein